MDKIVQKQAGLYHEYNRVAGTIYRFVRSRLNAADDNSASPLPSYDREVGPSIDSQLHQGGDDEQDVKA